MGEGIELKSFKTEGIPVEVEGDAGFLADRLDIMDRLGGKTDDIVLL
jgi:hypothetical protein